MTRAEYHAARRAIHAINQRIADRLHYHDMADSRLVVQMTSDAEGIVRLRRDRDAIQRTMPWCGADPLGFRTMHQNWARRRSHVEYHVRCRRRDAERLSRIHGTRLVQRQALAAIPA